MAEDAVDHEAAHERVSPPTKQSAQPPTGTPAAPGLAGAALPSEVAATADPLAQQPPPLAAGSRRWPPNDAARAEVDTTRRLSPVAPSSPARVPTSATRIAPMMSTT